MREAFAVLPVAVDRVVHATAPAIIAIGGEAPVFYFGLVLLSAQLWRLNAAWTEGERVEAAERRAH
jgi:hypothetical protein